MRIGIKDNFIAFILCAIGTIFLIYYVFRASTDVVSSDYIRIVKYYVDDVTDLKYLLAPEGISCIPFAFLARFINVRFFSYSVFFDKIIGTFGFFIFNFVVIKYILKYFSNDIVKLVLSIVVSLISFSLMPWEMILNGTGYAHIITMGLVAMTFYLFNEVTYTYFKDRKLENVKWTNIFPLMFCIYGLANFLLVFLARYIFVRTEYGMSSRYAIQYVFLTIGVILILSKFIDDVFSKHHDISDKYSVKSHSKFCMCILIIATSLLFAGSYSVGYLCTIILFSIIFAIVDIILTKRCKASSKIQNDKDEITDTTQSFNNYVVYFILLAAISFICLVLYIKSSNSGETLEIVGAKDITLLELIKTNPTFPIKFLLKSFASSIIGVETFDYAILFKTIDEKIIYIVGIIYFLITIWAVFIYIYRFVSCVALKNDISKMSFYKVIMVLVSVACIVCLLTGHLATSCDEINKADLRKMVYKNLEDIALDYESYDDETLMNSFEYHRDVEHIKEALAILESQRLNVFRKE